jgi:hypothetical protein
MYHLIAMALLAVGAVLALAMIPEKFYNKTTAGFIIQTVLLVYITILMPLGFAQSFALRIIASISIPIILTHLTIRLPFVRKQFSNLFGVEIDPDKMSSHDFFSSKFGVTMILTLLLIYFLLTQIVILGLFNFNSNPLPNFRVGQILPIRIYDLPNVCFLMLAFTVFPLVLSNALTKVTTKMAKNSGDANAYRDAMRPLGTLLGFLIAKYALTLQLVTPIEIVTTLIIVITLFATKAVDAFLKFNRLKLPSSTLRELFSHDETSFLFFIIYLIFLCMVLLITHLVPGLDYLRNPFKQSKLTSVPELFIHFFLFWITPSFTGLAIEKSLETTAEKGKKEDVDKTNGYALGYIIGYMLILSGFLTLKTGTNRLITQSFPKQKLW